MDTQTSSSVPETAPPVVNETLDRQLKVLIPPANAPQRVEVPESFFKLTPAEIKALHNSHVEYRQKLENAPLKTQKLRNNEELERMKKFPKATVRVRLPDGLILQANFLSKETVGTLYDYIRSTLETPERKFLLCLPPRTKLLDRQITLYKANLAPAANVIFAWIDPPTDTEKATALLKQEYLDLKEAMAVPGEPSSSPATPASPASASSSNASAPKAKSTTVPKWLQKGLFNKK